MKKKYTIEESPINKVADPAVSYNVRNTRSTSMKHTSTSEHIMSTTMSVDDYFDKLISLVREDYANHSSMGVLIRVNLPEFSCS